MSASPGGAMRLGFLNPSFSTAARLQRRSVICRVPPQRTPLDAQDVLKRLRFSLLEVIEGVKDADGKTRNDEMFLESVNREIRRGNFWTAEEMMLNAIELGPKREKVFLRLALLEQRREDADFARRVFEIGVRNNPECAALIQAWGLFESKQGETRRAVQLLLRAVALDPRNAPVLRWKRFNCCQDMYRVAIHASPNPRVSRRRLRNCLAISPTFAPAWVSLTMLELKQGRSPEAVRAQLLEGLRHCRIDHSLLTVWGLIERRLGNEKEAVDIFRARDRALVR